METEIKAYFNHCELERGFSKNTTLSYGWDLKRYADFMKRQGLQLAAIKKTHIVAFMAEEKKRGLSNRSLVRVVAVLRGFHRFLHREEILNADPTQHLQAPKFGRKIPQVLTADEIKRLLNAPNLKKASGIRDSALIEMLFSTGMRVSEICNLKLADVNLEGRTFRTIGKGNKERRGFFGPHAVKKLEVYLNKVRLRKEFESYPYFFIQTGIRGNYSRQRRAANEPLGTRSIRQMLVRYGKRLGIEKPLYPHLLRHAFASFLLDRGADLRSVQELMGHENLITTQIYIHVSNEKLKSVYDACQKTRRAKS